MKLFIFCTDDGTAGGHHIYSVGMGGNKGSTYDGGHRVPFFLHWPAGGFAQERRIKTLTAPIDVFPTLIDTANSQRDVSCLATISFPLLRQLEIPC